MATIEVDLTIKVDGEPILGSPITKTLTVSQKELLSVARASAGGYLAVGSDIASLSLLFLRADQSFGVKLNGSATAFTLNANGLLLMVDGLINVGAATNVMGSNLGSTSAAVDLLAGG